MSQPGELGGPPGHLDYAARVAMGVTGEATVASYGRASGDRGRSRVTSLARLSFGDTVPTVLFVLLLSPIAVSVERGDGAVGAWLVAGAVAIAASAMLTVSPLLHGRRVKVAVIAATNAGLVTALAAQLDSLALLGVLLVLRGVLVGIGNAVQRPLVIDVVPPEARLRALLRWRAASVLGAAAAAGVGALAVSGPEWGWRTIIAAAGGVAAALGLAAAFVDEPRPGGYEATRLARVVGSEDEPEVLGRPSVGEVFARVSRSAGARVSLTGYVGVGFAGIGSLVLLVRLLDDLGFTIGAALVALALVWTVAAVVVLSVGDGLEARRRAGPDRLAGSASMLLGIAAAGLLLSGFSPNPIGAVIGAGVTAAAGAIAAAVLDATSLSAVDVRDRAAIAGVSVVSVVGGILLSLAWLTAAGNRFDDGPALASLAIPVGLCAIATRRLGPAARQSFEERVDEIALRSEFTPVERPQTPRWAVPVTLAPRVALPPPWWSEAGSVVVPNGLLPVAPAGPSTNEDEEPDSEVERLDDHLPPVDDVADDTTPASAPPASSFLDPSLWPSEVLGDGARSPSESIREGVLVVGAAALLTPSSNGHARHAAPVDEPRAPLAHTPIESSGTAVLEARQVNFSYGSVQVLYDVDLRVEEGELVALLGPNGVGKSTLLRTLSGLAKPSTGQILLGGQDVTKIGAAKRVGLGLSEIVGGQAVFGTMTVAENLRMFGFSLGRDKQAVEAGLALAYEAFPKLADRRNQLGSTLSGGEQQMLGLSKALLVKPKVLLVDEFSLGLAPVVVGELMALVRALNAQGTAILLVEQSVNVALSLVRRVYFMEKGRLVYEGLADDLRRRPDLVAELTLGGHADRLSEAGA